MMTFIEFVEWLKQEYKEKFNFTQGQLQQMYENYLNDCLEG